MRGDGRGPVQSSGRDKEARRDLCPLAGKGGKGQVGVARVELQGAVEEVSPSAKHYGGRGRLS